MRCSGAVLLRAERNGATLLHLQEHSAARRTGLVHCVGPQGVAPARSRGASARLAGSALVSLLVEAPHISTGMHACTQ